MTIYYRELKHMMSMECISQGDLCAILNKSWCYVNNRMNGKFSWTIEEAYVICDTLKEPYTSIPRLFPRGGIAKGGAKAC